MARQGLKLPEVASRLGVPYHTLRKQLASPNVKYRDLIDISAALGVPLSTLQSRAEERAA